MTRFSILDALVASGVDLSLADGLAIADALVAIPVSRVGAIADLSRATGCGVGPARDAVDALLAR